jgi:hypothetical protein
VVFEKHALARQPGSEKSVLFAKERDQIGLFTTKPPSAATNN